MSSVPINWFCWIRNQESFKRVFVILECNLNWFSDNPDGESEKHFFLLCGGWLRILISTFCSPKKCLIHCISSLSIKWFFTICSLNRVGKRMQFSLVNVCTITNETLMRNENNGQARFLCLIFLHGKLRLLEGEKPTISILIAIHRNQTDASDSAHKSSRKMRLNYINMKIIAAPSS